MTRSELIKELATNPQHGHCVYGIKSATSGPEFLGMTNVRSPGPAGGFSHYALLFPGQETRAAEFQCKLLVIDSAPKKFLFFSKQTQEPLFIKLIYNNRSVDHRGAAFTEYMIAISRTEAERVKLAILQDPSILIAVFSRVFAQQFNTLNQNNTLHVHSQWSKYFQTIIRP